MKKVLFIAYYFPPLGGSGVQRSLKFVKYLAEFGWQPVVLSVNHKFTRWIKDASLLQEIPEEVKIYRTPTLELNWLFKALWGLRLPKLVTWLQRHLLIPDSEITWLPFAKRCIRRIVAEHKIDLVYITGAPFSAMLLGPYVKAEFNLKYVVDFRDEWTNNPGRLQAGLPQRSQLKELALERHVLSNCAAAVYAIPRYMKLSFEQKYPFLIQKPHREIFNGFDEAEFALLSKLELPKRKYLRLAHIGQFYDTINPALLWQALLELTAEKSINPDLIKIDLIGRNTPSFVLGRYKDRAELRKMVRFRANLAHQLALKEMCLADALLLFIVPGPNCNAVATGKIFEYIRSYRPILAIIPPGGVAAEIVSSSRTGFVYDSSDLHSIKSGLLHICSLWERGELNLSPDKEYIRGFDRKQLTAQLAGLFDEVLSTKQSRG